MRLVRYTQPNRSYAPVSAYSRSPWAGLEGEIDRLFSSALTDFMGSPTPDRFAVDLYEDQENAYVRAELPGFNREDLNVEVVEGYLNIEGSRKTKRDGEDQESIRCSRSISLPDEVQADRVSATYENGVLTVTLPKKEEAKPRKISVAVS
jgi:HSP20 family protein